MGTNVSILEGYILEKDFAADGHISLRTSARYRNEVNGLPHVEFGGRIYIPLAEAQEWLKRRIRRPNRRRKGL